MNILLVALLSAVVGDLPNEVLYSGTSAQVTPVVSGNWVVWTDKNLEGNGDDIYALNLATHENVIVCQEGFEQSNPAISGDKVVWQDKRNGSNFDIYMFDLTTRKEREICVWGGKQVNPAISGNIIVWEDARESGNSDIYGYNLATDSQFYVCTSTGNQVDPAIDGNTIIWRDTTNTSDVDIYRLTLPSQTPVRLPIAGNQQSAAIYGNYIIWQELVGGVLNTFGQNFATGQNFTICSRTNNQSTPAIYGDWVVWQEIYGINAKNIVSQQELTVCSGQVDNPQSCPAIYGNMIVWQGGLSGSEDIYVAYIPVPTTVTLAYPNGGENFRSGKAGHIDWQIGGSTPDTVKIEISPDSGANWTIIDANAANTGIYSWTPASQINSSTCKIRVSAADSSAASVGVFTVYDCAASLTADLTGDCKVDIRDFAEFAVQWLACGSDLTNICGNL